MSYKITPALLEELIEAADACTETGLRLRSDLGGHELSLAALCNVLGRISVLNVPTEAALLDGREHREWPK